MATRARAMTCVISSRGYKPRRLTDVVAVNGLWRRSNGVKTFLRSQMTGKRDPDRDHDENRTRSHHARISTAYSVSAPANACLQTEQPAHRCTYTLWRYNSTKEEHRRSFYIHPFCRTEP